MKIKDQFTNPDGSIAYLTYEDADSFEHLLSKKVTQVYGICFVGDKLLVVHNEELWGPVGGGLEIGETFEECLKREIKEESNMKVLDFYPIGYQEVVCNGETIYQLRYAALLEPYGDFESDPDGDVTEIKLIDPREYKQYFDWGEVSNQLVSRAIELLSKSTNGYSGKYLGKTVTIKIDRPIRSKHPKHDFIYEVNYGFVPGTKAPDGEELDTYLLGVNEPVGEYTGRCIAIIHRTNDDDDKLIIVPEGEDFSDEEIQKATNFQEQFFKSIILR